MISNHHLHDLSSACSELKAAARDQETCLRHAYDMVTRHFRAGKFDTYFRIWRLFRRDLGRVWESGGFAHCTHLNQCLVFLLVHSGWFNESDCTRQWTLVSWWSPHQYLRLRLKDGRLINVDVWGRTYGIPFGEYAHGFNTARLPVGK